MCVRVSNHMRSRPRGPDLCIFNMCMYVCECVCLCVCVCVCVRIHIISLNNNAVHITIVAQIRTVYINDCYVCMWLHACTFTHYIFEQQHMNIVT
jgi:hypothetical protein